MPDTRFVFLMSGEFEPTVIDSQVVDTICSLEGEGLRFELTLLMHGGVLARKLRENLERRHRIAERVSGPVRILPVPLQDRSAGRLLGGLVLGVDAAAHPARRTIFHARGDIAASFVAGIRRRSRSVRLIYDVRGDSVAEQEMYAARQGISPVQSVDGRRFAVARALAARAADHLFCVSTVLGKRMAGWYGLPADRISVTPCVADPAKFFISEPERATARAELGLDGRFVVVYPGRFGRWHEGPQVFEIVRAMMDVEPSVYFLVLTPDVADAEELGRARLPSERWRVITARHAEVARYLRASDLGILIRESHPLNEVACPTKFAEFVMTGLPVLVSDGIGDCSPFVARHGAGILLQRNDPAAATMGLRRLLAEDAGLRRERIAGAASWFSRQRIAREMAAVYRRLAAEP